MGRRRIAGNNGSTDHSDRVFKELLVGPVRQFTRVTTVPVNRGYGFGILSGLRDARGDVLAWTHADLQTDPADVVAGFELLSRQPDSDRCFVRGRRIGRPWFDRLFTWGMGIVATAALGRRLYDVNAQPKIFPRSLGELLTDAPTDFSLDLYLLNLSQIAGYRNLELPVQFGRRLHGVAKGGGSLRGKFKLIRRTLSYTLRLRREMRGGSDRFQAPRPHLHQARESRSKDPSAKGD